MLIGCNYWAGHAAVDMWREWRPEQIAVELDTLKEIGIERIRIFPNWRDFQPLEISRTVMNWPRELLLAGKRLPRSGAGKYGVDDITGTTAGILEGHFANPHAWKDETTKERFLKIKEQCPANSFYGGIIQYTGKSIKKFPELAEFLRSRRSCRTFAPEQVDPALLQEAVKIAQSAPSACNRQPVRVHIYTDPEQIRKIVYAQHADIEWCIHAPVLIIISANEYYYRDYLERNQKMFDAGLFAMTLNLVLHNMGIGSCFKMAQKYPCYDRETKTYAEIPEYEDICVLMPAGYYPDSPVATAKSIRISENIVCKVHK